MNSSFRVFVVLGACSAALLLTPLPSQATPITFTGSSGSLSAEATFDTSGTNLIVTLTNTSGSNVVNAAQVLTAVFFSLTGNPALGRTSAVLNAGSTVINGGVTDPGGVVGGEWAYDRNDPLIPGGA